MVYNRICVCFVFVPWILSGSKEKLWAFLLEESVHIHIYRSFSVFLSSEGLEPRHRTHAQAKYSVYKFGWCCCSLGNARNWNRRGLRKTSATESDEWLSGCDAQVMNEPWTLTASLRQMHHFLEESCILETSCVHHCLKENNLQAFGF